MIKNKLVLNCLQVLIILAIVYEVCVHSGSRYATISEAGGGPMYATSRGKAISLVDERRIDRWTALEERRYVRYGKTGNWQIFGWNPIESLMRF